jgi:hypothetical protein
LSRAWQREAEERTKKQAAAVDPKYIEQLSARVESAEKIVIDLSVEICGRHLKRRRKPGRQEEARFTGQGRYQV